MSMPYTVEVITTYRVTTLDGKYFAEGADEDEAVTKLKEISHNWISIDDEPTTEQGA